MALAGALEIELSANVARLQSDMQAARGVVSNTMQGIERAVAGAKSALASLGVGIGIGALTALGKSAIDAADNLNDLSKSTGLAVEDLAGLGVAAKQSGANLEGVAQTVNKLSVNMGKNAEHFKTIGVTAKEPLEALKQLADVFSKIEDPQLRAALGAEALGKNWASAAPLLAEGGAKIGEMVEKGKLFSGVTKEMAEQSDALNDKLVLLTGTSGTLNRAIAPLLPLLNKLADDMLRAKEESLALGGASNFSPLLEAGKALVVLFGNVAFVFKGIGNEIGGIAAQMAALAVGDFKRAAEIGRIMTADAVANRKAFDAWEQSIMSVGTASRSTSKDIDSMDQVSRRMKSDAEAQARAFIDSEKRNKEAADAAKKAADEAKHLRDADIKGWVQYADTLQDNDFKLYTDLAKINDDYWKAVEHRRMEALDAETKAAEMFADDYAEAWKFANEFIKNEDKKTADQFKADWGGFFDGIESGFRDAWDAFASHGKSAAEVLKNALKRTLFDWIYQQFAKPIVLQLVASIGGVFGMGGGGPGGAISGLSSLAGLSNLLPGGSIGAAFGSGASSLASMFGVENAGFLSAIGEVGSFIPVAGAVIAGVALLVQTLNARKGGPKDEGQFVTGGPTAFNIVGTTANVGAEQFARTLGQQIAAAIKAFGGTGPAFDVGVGIVRDPRGDAQTMLDTLLRLSGGAELLRIHNDNVGRSDEALTAELQLQSQRAILAALKASDLPANIASIFASLSPENASLAEITDAFDRAARAQAEFAQAAADAAAMLEQITQEYENVQQSIDTLLGRDRRPGQLSDAAAAFQAANSQFGGLTAQELVDTLTTITEQDFANYSAENRALIQNILALAAALKDNTQATVQQTTIQQNTLYNPTWTGTKEQWMAQYMSGFNASYGGVIGEQPTLMDKFTLQVQLMQEQIAKWQTEYSSVVLAGGPYSPQALALQETIQAFQQMIGQVSQYGSTGLIGDISKLTILTAQYGQDKAEKLFDLQKWYDGQKALVGSSATAMDALNEIFQTKWNEILQGVASSDALASAKQRLGEWWNKLFLNEQLSPLTLQQRFAEAKSQYSSTLALAQAGDVNAIGNLSGISETVLQLARQLMASSPAYTALFREIATQTGGIAGISDADVNSRLYSALPTSGTLASSADIARLDQRLAELTTALLTEPITVQSPTLEEAITTAAEPAGTGLLA